MRKYGPEQSQATHYLYFCYDDFWGSPNVLEFTKTAALQAIERLAAECDAAEVRKEELGREMVNLKNGTAKMKLLLSELKELNKLVGTNPGEGRRFEGARKGARRAGVTGYGYKILPEELNAIRTPFLPNAGYADLEIGERGECDAADWLIEKGWEVVREDDATSQKTGIDIYATKNGVTRIIDVKAREPFQNWPMITMQLEESNPDKRYV
jgi:hypothetical protein